MKKKTENTNITEERENKTIEIKDTSVVLPLRRGGVQRTEGLKNKEEAVEKPQRVREAIKSTISKITKNYDIKTELKDVENKWSDIKKKFAEKYHALSIILEMSDIKEINSKGLILAVPFSLHKDKLLEREPKQEMEIILENLFEEKIPFNCVVEAKKTAEENTNELAVEFGGEVM